MTNSKASQTWVLALASVASLMVALDALVVTTALSTIRLDLGASIANLEWTVNAYSLSFAVLLMTAAALGDRYGRRRLFAGGLGLFVAASAACALAPGVGWLIAARAVQGAGAALVMPLALALLSAAFPPERRAWAMGIFSGVTGIAVLGGPLVGGAIAQGISWQWIFWLNVPIGLVVIPLVLRRMDEGFGPRAGLDVAGVALATGASLGVVWGLVRGNSAGWGSAEVVGALVAGALLLVAFVAWELRAREPMLPMALFRSRAFSSGNAANLFMVASLFGAVFFMAQFLQTAKGYGPLGAGLRLMPWTATLFVVAPIAGSLVSRIGERPLITGGLLLQAGGLAWIASIAGPHMSYASLVPPLMLAGCGVSMAMPASQNVVMNAVKAEAIGKASGTFNMVRQLGGVLGIAIAVAVFSGAGGYRSAQAFSDGFSPALGVSAALSLAGAIAGATLPGRRRARDEAPARAIPQAEGAMP
ncbi:MAG: drug resistance transporter, EmrB/QacA subfamily [Solirubrobacterales bacterium]|nr:drug resistance transporter, EmrB/QacA subfamily [Solirubrobacterales bacterium]